MARDVLAIPISTVAFESAFSTGGRVLDTFRSSLTPKTIKALVCSQDWLRAAPLLFEVKKRIDELEQIETGKLIFFISMVSKLVYMYLDTFFDTIYMLMIARVFHKNT